MIRPAAPSDAKAILDVGMRLADGGPLRPDKDRMWQAILTGISAPSDLTLVSTSEGALRGVLLARVGDNAWAQRKLADLQLWWSDRPGVGAALLRRFKRWVTDRNAIKLAGFAPAWDLDPRTYALLERCGFRRSGGAYLWVRGRDPAHHPHTNPSAR